MLNLASKYGKGLEFPIEKLVLPKDWDLLRNYNDIPGIYQFCNKNGSYVGSSKNLFTRCFKDHRLRALSKTSRHNKFYREVVTQ